MKFNILIIAILVSVLGCNSEQDNTEKPDQRPLPAWIQNATIYEVNLRQHTLDGTIESFKQDLPRLKELGVDVLWFMPIQPVGKLNRKAVGDTFVQDMPDANYEKYWGSHYSVANYTDVHPRYGTVEEFSALVKECHEMGIKVILDWVANHTAWDNPWVAAHPDWYTKDSTGKITDPIGEDGKSWGWTDVADLNYESEAMREEMIQSMKFWVEECDIDGFRCDVAMEVPTDFWEQVRTSLDEVKPMFMLAESETHKPDHFNYAFDAYYGWEMHHVMNDIYSGKRSPDNIIDVTNVKDSINGLRAFPMNFITNHDENSWNGTINERLAESWRVMSVLPYALRGMPLIYSGQEAGLNHRLKFFEKDSIDWDAENSSMYFNHYKKLNTIKEHESFAVDAPYQFYLINESVLIVERGESCAYRIVLNLSGTEQAIEAELVEGFENEDSHEWEDNTLGTWGYVILKKG